MKHWIIYFIINKFITSVILFMAKFDVKIENIVASITIGKPIPIANLLEKNEEIEYEPEQFPGLVYRMKQPKAAALIFNSGKIICTGSRSMEDLQRAVRKILQLLRSAGVNARNPKINIENVVGSTKFKGEIDLNELAWELENSEYEPEQFPGLVYRKDKPKVAFLIFRSGKVICTGGKSIEEVKREIKNLYNMLKKSKAADIE